MYGLYIATLKAPPPSGKLLLYLLVSVRFLPVIDLLEMHVQMQDGVIVILDFQDLFASETLSIR